MIANIRAGLLTLAAFAALVACGTDKPAAQPTPQPSGQVVVGTATESSSPTPPATTPSASPTPEPTGPRIVSFKVVDQPSCPAGTNLNPIPGNPLKVSWTVAGAAGITLSVDGPGIYNSYGVTGEETFSFGCSGPPNTYATHTYKLTTVGGGTPASQTLTVKAKINEIAQV